MLVPFSQHVKRVPQNLVALKLRLRPVRRDLLDLKSSPIFQVLAQSIHRLAKHSVCLALVHLKRTDLVHKIIDHIAQVHRVQHSKSKINRELQPRLARLGLDSIAVFEQQHSEPVKSRILQRKAIFGLIHSESARATRSRGEKDIVIQNLLAWDTLLLQKLEILHQVSHREIGRITLPVIAKLLSRLESGNVRDRKLLAVVAATLEHRANQVFVLPCEPAKQNCDAVALLRLERPLDGPVEVTGRAKSRLFSQTGSFGREALLEFLILPDLYESRCHVVSFSGLPGVVFPKLLCSGGVNLHCASSPLPRTCSLFASLTV